MKLLRELVYEEKPSRNDFGINDKGSLNNRLYNEWLLLRKELDPEDSYFYSKITKAFNDAYFVCTVVLMWPEREIALSYFKNKISMPNIVYPMVHYYLSLLKERKQNTDRLMKMIENMMNKNPEMKKNYDDLPPKGKNSALDSSMFDHRKPTLEVLSSMDWRGITNGYRPEEIKRIITLIATNGEEFKMMAEVISEAAKLSEDEFYNPLPNNDYVDDNDQYEEPDYDPNIDIIEPDYSEAYQLCEEIIKSEGTSLTLINRQTNNESETLQGQEKTFAIKKRLKDFLNEDWFDEFSNDSGKYTKDWREKMIDDLIESEYGDELVQMWNKKPSPKNLIKCSLAGALIDTDVLIVKYNKLAPRLGISIKNKTLEDYMGSKKIKDVLKWLREYLNNHNDEPFSD